MKIQMSDESGCDPVCWPKPNARRQENGHSKVIASILAHTYEGKPILLQSFILYLSNMARIQEKESLSNALRKIKVSDNVEIETEYRLPSRRRVDILIRDINWAIVIENKIAGAPDEYRQIPDYLNGIRNVVAVVYLKSYLDNKGPVFQAGWCPCDHKKVKAKLIPVAGYKGAGDKSSLCVGWIEGLAMRSCLNDEAAMSALKWYSKELREHARQVEDDSQIAKAVAKGIFKEGPARYSEDYYNLTWWLARKIEHDYVRVEPLSNVWCYTKPKKGVSCIFDFSPIVNKDGEAISFALDVHCGNLRRMGMSFHLRYRRRVNVEGVLNAIEPILGRMKFCLGRINRSYRLWCKGVELRPDDLVAKVNEILKFVSDNWVEIENAVWRV